MPFLLFDDRAVAAAEELVQAANAQQRGTKQTKADSRSLGTSTPQFAARGLTPMTNDLQIDIEEATNGVVSLTVLNPTSLTNDPPAWDVWGQAAFNPNPDAWVWLARTEPGQTNILVPMLAETESYYRLASISNDVDGDGILDSWMSQNFGHVTAWASDHTLATNDYDGDGTNNYDEFIAGSNPNDFKFTTHFASLFVNQQTVSGNCEVQGGVPAWLAVMVNSTNLAAANWQAYSSNFSVTLGGTDGVYAVRVYLWGRSGAFAPVMDYTELTLDRVAPVLTITNPLSANATVTKPYLQLMGAANEPLVSLSYDLTNALGWVTNQPAYVVDQAFDTNLFDFTTNYFQAYDIPLVTNANYLTLRVQDRAGNVTTTNLAVTLDYTGATNAPVFAPRWPTNGMHVSGDTFYVRGKIDDETAQLSASWLDDAGATNTVAGMVERNGIFWVENLPLRAGTNVLTLVAMNAAGYASTNVLSVIKSDLLLTISSTPEGSALYDGVGAVSGTVSATGCAITINGVSAAVDGTNWSASNVPVLGLGTATFDLRATPPSGPDAFASRPKEMPAIIKVTKHYLMQRAQGFFVGPWTSTWIKSYSAAYEPNANGEWQARYRGNATSAFTDDLDGLAVSWSTDYAWSDADPTGTYHTVNNITGESSGTIGDADWLVKTVPDQQLDHTESEPFYDGDRKYYVEHFFASGVRHEWTWFGGNAEETLVARTVPTHYTGGRQGIARMALHERVVDALGYGTPEAPLWNHTPHIAVAANQITLNGKPVGSDFAQSPILPDNAAIQLAVMVAGGKDYKVGLPNSKADLQVTNFTMTGDPQTYKIKCDTNGAEYTGAHWSSNTTTHIVASHPALYVSGSLMTADVRFEVRGGGVGRKVAVKGEGSGYTFRGTNNTASDHLDVSVIANTSLPTNKVDWLKLKIDWSYKAENEPGDNYAPAGTSSNQVYVSWQAPTTANLFHTVVDVACRNAVGQTVESNIVAGIWGEFEGLELGVKDARGRGMKYWKPGGWSAWNFMDTPELVNFGAGKCGAWREFFSDTMALHGIATSMLQITPNVPAPEAPTNYPTLFSAYFTAYPSHAGQGNNGPPLTRLDHGDGLPIDWVNHDVSLYTNSSSVTIFDPSYGLRFTTNSVANAKLAWELNSVQGFAWVFMDATNGMVRNFKTYSNVRTNWKPTGDLLKWTAP